MKKLSTFSATLLLALPVAFIAYAYTGNKGHKVTTTPLTPEQEEFQPYRNEVPPDSVYSGPLFKLSHNYPESVNAVVNPPWDRALKNQPLSQLNVFAYMNALKGFVAPNLIPFFTDNSNWDAAKHHWFHEPWTGIEREPILGTYQGNGNSAHMFKSLTVDEAGYVLTLYNPTAAYTVGKIWGKSGKAPNLLNNATQFKEGSVIVKLAFSNVNGDKWPVMQGAQTFKIYDTLATDTIPTKKYKLRKVSFFQMDIIVKDSKASPKTGWVYSTFVYDKDVNGGSTLLGFWNQMVPLGAMWGNDPDIISPITPPYPRLRETAINPNAPFYSKETLGWGGRLSGPNDGAVALNDTDFNGTAYKRLALSSCMSCHSPAQDQFVSFLLPAASDSTPTYVPRGKNWRLWFQNRPGNVPFNQGQVAMDYDMVMAFKSLTDYLTITGPIKNQIFIKRMAAIKRFRKHSTNALFWH